MTSDSWFDAANCLGLPATMFFPEPGETAAPARRVCAACRVRRTCLDYANRNRIRIGIFGGLTHLERLSVRRGNADEQFLAIPD